MRVLRRVLAAVFGVGAVLAVGAPPASAHPLGNFSVNQYHALVVRPDRITDSAVLDIAEIPTLQAEPDVDIDHDGVDEPRETAAYAARTCEALARAVDGRSSSRTLTWRADRAVMEYRPGAAGLRTSRFTCELSAAFQARPGSVLDFRTGYLTDRVGWREITARGEGVAVAADVPAQSLSDGLRTYPRDLLGDPLDVRTAHLRLGATAVAGARHAASNAGGWAVSAERAVAGWDRRFASVAEARHLTIALALAALAMAVVLGAAHATLPGHGKTLMAACLAGRRGGLRDAASVAGAVTVAHTGSVLVTGLLLTASAHFAADRLMRWLAVVSGLMVVAAGVAMVRGAVRRGGGGHGHSHGHGHGFAIRPGLRRDSDHDHSDGHSHTHSHSHDRGRLPRRSLAHHHAEHRVDHPADHPHLPETGRATLIGMAAAGGVLPSPTALLVLLGAVALGRTTFGIVLVVAYGLGMAATLAAVGLLAAKAGRSLPARLQIPAVHARLRAWTPIATAAAVLLVGVGLTLRASIGLV